MGAGGAKVVCAHAHYERETWGLLHKTFTGEKTRVILARVFSYGKVNGPVKVLCNRPLMTLSAGVQGARLRALEALSFCMLSRAM